jgi:hypothetical protein
MEIRPGELIERCPVVVLDNVDRLVISKTILRDYYLFWEEKGRGEWTAAIACGCISFCNHSDRPSAYIARKIPIMEVEVYARDRLAPGAEVTIDYGYPVPFDDVSGAA